METKTVDRTAEKTEAEIYPFISVVIPVRNEGSSVGGVIESLLEQSYPHRRYEIIVVDGESEDNTKEVVENFSRQNSQIRLFNNPKRLSGAGKNIGVKNSRGEIILFVDGHCYLPGIYLLREISRLYLRDDRRVLCRPQPLDFPGNSLFQRAVAGCRATLWGHGLDSTIYSEKEGQVNPTSSGAIYPRKLFEEVGYIDESFDACEDVEFNYCCHRAGYKGFTSPKLKVCYEPRSNLVQLFRQMYRYGLGRFRLFAKHPGSFSLGQLPPVFLVLLLPLSALGLILGGIYASILLSTWGLYFSMTFIFSISVALNTGLPRLFLSPPIFFVIHLGLGCGFLAGAVETSFRRRGRRFTSNGNGQKESSSKIKVMFIIDSLRNRKAGTEKILASLIERLDRERFEPILCCLHGSDNLRFRECRSLNLELRSFASFRALKGLSALARFLKKEKVDLLVTFFKNANYFGTLAGRISGVPKIISSRRNLGYWQSGRDLLLLKIMKRWTDFVIANSGAVRDTVVKKEGVDAGKTGVIYNGIDSDEFTNRLIPREEAKRRLGLSAETPLVGTLSNFRPVKAVDIFIKSAFVVSKRFPQTKFMIVGEGPQRRDLETLVERLGIKDRVVFAGGAEEVFPYLSAFDIGVLSSSSEGFSNSILEYMLAGLPVVASGVGGNPEIIDEGENGYLVPPGEPQPLAEKIMALLGDERLRLSLGENARFKVLENFSLKRMVAEFESCFMRLWGQEGGADDGDIDLQERKVSVKEESLVVLSGKGV